ncbi:DUF2244 domain-containing protein [Jannaschia ovalis]|uniref:DUF2244 domain-containing protein n=1 Tax=Jannaschia ovalis TaxID=3038773 RepID=A0ABY8LFE4_9RHOB|nr:DUF2244 domain-containing protein [Jannaschia sp. GRR-S6-38]WGH78884.1 DUF2244 domain-containing protein [Jannaschia sp. GRR-S6-38]
MPINVIHDLSEAPENSGASLLELELWPHQSLTGTGFVWIIGASFGMLCIPLIGLMGTVALWGILPFCMAVLGLLWLSLKRSWHDRDILERLVLTPEEAHLTRRDPDGSTRDWQANPYWVRVERHDKVGSIEDYLTLEGGPRAVEIGAFLTPAERRGLERRILRALGRING